MRTKTVILFICHWLWCFLKIKKKVPNVSEGYTSVFYKDLCFDTELSEENNVNLFVPSRKIFT